jgi:hypothetical protein
LLGIPIFDRSNDIVDGHAGSQLHQNQLVLLAAVVLHLDDPLSRLERAGEGEREVTPLQRRLFAFVFEA